MMKISISILFYSIFFLSAFSNVSAYELLNDMFTTSGGRIEGSTNTISTHNMQPYAETGQPSAVIEITSNLEECGFVLTGPVTYNGSGSFWREENAFPGWYAVSFNSVDCWRPPDGQSLLVREGQTVGLHGEYTDNSNPSPPLNLQTTPAPDQWSNSGTISAAWNPGTDCGTGVAGYSYLFNTQPAAEPDNTVDATGTSIPAHPVPDGDGHYFHIKTIDGAGNGSITIHRGPFRIDTATSITIDEDAYCVSGAETMVSGQREAGETVTVACPTAGAGAVEYPSDNTWRVSVSNLPEGVNSLTAEITDRAGNTASAQTEIRRFVPKTAEFIKNSGSLVADGVGLLDLTVNIKNAQGEASCEGLPVQLTTSLGEIVPDGVLYTENGVIQCQLEASRTLGAANVVAMYDGNFLGNTSVNMIVGPLNKLAFISNPQNIPKNTPSGFIQLQTQDFYGHPVNVENETKIFLSSHSGDAYYFSADGIQWNPGEILITLNAGTNLLYFKYKAAVEGIHNLTAREYPDSGLGDGAQEITITGVKQYLLEIETGGKGVGAVTSQPAGIQCGDSCDAYFDENTLVNLTAAPETGYEFKGWSGNGCSGTGTCAITMDQNRKITAEFAPLPDYTAKAIIVAGGGPQVPGWYNSIWGHTLRCANYAYKTLKSQGYSDDTIHYLCPERFVDADGDKIADVDADATLLELRLALTQWANAPDDPADDLLIYLVDHGGPGTFRMNNTEILEAAVLDEWLDDAQQYLSGNLIFVYDACYSGSFLPIIRPQAGQKRFVISSASDENAWFLLMGRHSFSWHFWSAVFEGNYLHNAFTYAKDMMFIDDNSDRAFQHPLLDADNGIGNEKTDFALSSNVIIGEGRMALSDMPYIENPPAGQTLYGETHAEFELGPVIDADGVESVWAYVISPFFKTGPPDMPVTELPVFYFQDDNHDGIYQGGYDQFIYQGDYELVIYAMDAQGVVSPPEYVMVHQVSGLSALRGDVNGNSEIDLADALILLKLLTNVETVSLPANIDHLDIDGDKKLGLPEIIYVLRELAD